MAPTVLLNQWSDEIQRWLPDVPAEGIQVIRKVMHMKNKQKLGGFWDFFSIFLIVFLQGPSLSIYTYMNMWHGPLCIIWLLLLVNTQFAYTFLCPLS